MKIMVSYYQQLYIKPTIKTIFGLTKIPVRLKLTTRSLKQDNIEDLKAVGLDGFEDYYIEELDNKTTREYLKRRNSSIRK